MRMLYQQTDRGRARAFARTNAVPKYQGIEWIHGHLPTETEAWPKFRSRVIIDAAGDDYDVCRDEIREFARGRPWIWPDRTIYFFSDLHADADAFLTSLVASGGVAKTGPGDSDFELTGEGKKAVFVLGGDCFDKGPSNLRLLRVVKLLIETGAEVHILAGNHDVRAAVGLFYAGDKSPAVAHLFVRMGQKAVPLFREVWDEYLSDVDPRTLKSDDQVRAELFPDESWFEEFPAAVAEIVTEVKVQKELLRIREKMIDLVAAAAETGMTLGMIDAARRKLAQLFLEPGGEFFWYFDRMQLALRLGSFLMIHAGVDDLIAKVLRQRGVAGLNERFRQLMSEDLFLLYHGPVGNTFRTKYRDFDLPLTERGVRDMYRAGIYAVVHGHQNILRGQRVRLRCGLLNFECDASVDRNTRIKEGLDGIGGAVTILRPDGTLLGISTDYPYVKLFKAATVLDLTAIV